MAKSILGIWAGIGILCCTGWFSTPTRADLISWVAGGVGNSWSTGANWSDGVGPGVTDTAVFDNGGAVFLPGEVTNFLDASEVIGGLAYNNSGAFHTTDLGGFTLGVFGSLNFNTNQPGLSTTTIRDGVLIVADPFGSVNVGRSFGSGAKANVNLGGLTQFAATVNQFQVGTSIGGTASGELTLAQDNVIVADQVVIGNDGGAQLHLGATNEFVTGDFIVAKDFSNAIVDIVNGGHFELGTAERRTLLSIADQDTNTNSSLNGRVDLTGGTMHAFLDGLIVGRKFGGPGVAVGELIGGNGHIDIGAEGNTANIIIGQSVDGGTARGTVDFSGMQSLTANLNQLIVGQSFLGNARGTLILAADNTIDAHSILVGDNAGGTLTTLRLGQTNVITTHELIVAKDFSNATIDIINGGSLDLGTAEQRTLLSIADQDINTNSSLNGRVDLTGGTVNAFLDGLIVGRKFGGPGTTVGELIGGTGHVDIGAEGNTANVIIGQSVNGGTARGTVDFGGMQSLTANLNQLIVGQSFLGSAGGTLILAAENSIDANSILVGDSASGTLRLGQSNTIVADEFVIARKFSNARVEVPLGAMFHLGTPDRRTNLSIGVFDANTNSRMSGEMDLTGVTFGAYLGEVFIGERTGGGSGIGTGVLTIGSDPNNDVDAESITLGISVGRGTLNFHGGSLSADSIQRGTGVAAFNWLGGTLSVEAFGSPAREFDLNNLGFGTLAPGDSPGATDVFGDYRQGGAATYQVDIGGTTPVVQHDLLNVSVLAELDGMLDARLFDGFAPGGGDSFTIVMAGSISGEFANAPAGASSLVTPFGTYDVAYTSTDVILSNFVPDPLASAASIGTQNGHSDDVLGGMAVTGGVDATFQNNERGILSGQFDVVDGMDLMDLVNNGMLDFDNPNFALPADQLQVWNLEFEGDPIGMGGLALVFGYDDTGLTMMEEAALDIFHFDGGMWVPLGGTVDTLANTISVNTPSLSSFGVGLVPEPSALVLAVLGSAGFAVFAARYRRKRRVGC